MGENLIFKRIKSEGLAHISYFVGSNKEAVVIDPRRDCQVYVDLARREEIKVKYIFEIHRNEDYVIGSLKLAILPFFAMSTSSLFIRNGGTV
jgi:hydroxyacylglutathione hydrolase